MANGDDINRNRSLQFVAKYTDFIGSSRHKNLRGFGRLYPSYREVGHLSQNKKWMEMVRSEVAR